jgi:hypothetical protein
MPVRRLFLVILAALLCSGCLEIREEIRLKKDGSGSVQMVVSFPQVTLRWLPGKPLASWVRPSLPEGVRLKSFENTQSTTTFVNPDGKKQELASEVYHVDLEFDQVAALGKIRVRPDNRNSVAAAVGATPGKSGSAAMKAEENPGPSTGPFQELSFTEEGDLLRFRRVVQEKRDPDEVVNDALNRPGSTSKPKGYDLGQSSLVISIHCPGDIVKHNAHKVDGRRLTWTFNLEDLQQQQDRDWTVEFTCQKEEK